MRPDALADAGVALQECTVAVPLVTG
jgi:hypothetical protein